MRLQDARELVDITDDLGASRFKIFIRDGELVVRAGLLEPLADGVV